MPLVLHCGSQRGNAMYSGRVAAKDAGARGFVNPVKLETPAGRPSLVSVLIVAPVG